MKLLRIKAPSMREALAEARRQLGDDATVLHTKQYDDPALLGLAKKRCVEILAAVDETASVAVASAQVATLERPSEDEIEKLSRQIADMRHVIAKMDAERTTVKQPEVSPVVERLIRNGVPEKLAAVFSPELNAAKDSAAILDLIARRIRCVGQVNCAKGQARIALVGPTGAGKTTTAAKLAAQHALIHKKSVALITLDTYRIGAVEQLSTYAKILGIPFEVPLCAEDVDVMVRKHRDKDVIIIDTVGRSQRNKEHLSELGRFIRPAAPTEVHLVISASASPAVQKEAVDSFGALSVDRLILTKLDECPQPGCILDLAATSLLPFSYITFGQEVPDDICAAEKDRLSRLVWEGVQ